MASDRVSTVNESNFESEVLQCDRPVLIDFTATWCGPCKALAPIVEDVAKEYDGKLKVAKVDIDESPAIAQRYAIRGVPTVMVFKNGAEVAKNIGLVPRPKLVALFKDHL